MTLFINFILEIAHFHGRIYLEVGKLGKHVRTTLAHLQ